MFSGQDPRPTLHLLQRRLDEVRSLARRPLPAYAPEEGNSESLLETALELAEELERSQRQLIETNVQLVSLREVANSLFATRGSEEATRVVSRYLMSAFPFPEVLLCLTDTESGKLAGVWMHREGGAIAAPRYLRIPLDEDSGVISHAVWQNRMFTIRDAQTHPPLRFSPSHPLADLLSRLTTYTIVPLQRNRTPAQFDESPDACPAGCPMRFGAPLDGVPEAAEDGRWAERRAQRRRRCLECNRFPILGVLGVATSEPGQGLDESALTLLESVALTVAPILENAQLYHDLQRNQRYLDHVLNSVSAGLVAIGQNGRLLTFNRAAEELTGHQSSYVAGEPLELLFPDSAAQLVRAALRGGQLSLREEARVRRASGEEVPVSLTTSLLRDEEGRVYGAVVAFSDLSRIKRMEERIRQLDRLAALGRFTTSVAHEIRNPLAGIAAGVEYLGKSLAARKEDAEHIQFIRREISRLDRIIGDLFTVTHPKKLSPRLVDAHTLLAYSVQGIQVLVEDRRLQVATEIPAELPLIAVDPDQMQQVFLNLLKNAAEVSPEGGVIRLRASVAPPTGEGPHAPGERAFFAEIEDQGSGIAPEALGHLFEPFFTTKPQGTGLGLYVSHDIVKRHGGGIRVESPPGAGARFTVELPLDTTLGENDG